MTCIRAVARCIHQSVSLSVCYVTFRVLPACALFFIFNILSLILKLTSNSIYSLTSRFVFLFLFLFLILFSFYSFSFPFPFFFVYFVFISVQSMRFWTQLNLKKACMNELKKQRIIVKYLQAHMHTTVTIFFFFFCN